MFTFAFADRFYFVAAFADPMVGIFVHANEVPYAGALEFTVNIDDAVS